MTLLTGETNKLKLYNMTTQEFIDTNKTASFKKGDQVIMHTCGEADFYKGKTWVCKTDSYERNKEDLVFLEEFSGCFMCKYLKKG